MNSPGDFLLYYDKIKSVIESSITYEHLKVSEKMLDSLTSKCLISQSIPYSFYIIYIQNLRLLINLKLKEVED
jgi:hypothetical protein